MKWNIVKNEGEESSVTVFAGSDMLIATKDHPNFQHIVTTLRSNPDPNEFTIKGMFDISYALEQKFEHLSERVMINRGRIFFDGVGVDNALTQTILRFHSAGVSDFQSLVNFMEKIETNPSDHSRKHLFRWLSKHDFALHPDGDFIAYKGVNMAERKYFSSNFGTAIVNGQLVTGKIPNMPGTVIEMPRDQVTFDPHNGCSTGLHAGNWRYASTFTNGTVLRVKINPRDVVSVPTDSSDEKLRVCRYRVLDRVSKEATDLVFLGRELTARFKVETEADVKPALVEGAKPQRAPRKKTQTVPVFPEYYEQYKKAHFMALPMTELRWLAKEWEIKIPRSQPGVPWGKPNLIELLLKAARARLRTW